MHVVELAKSYFVWNIKHLCTFNNFQVMEVLVLKDNLFISAKYCASLASLLAVIPANAASHGRAATLDQVITSPGGHGWCGP